MRIQVIEKIVFFFLGLIVLALMYMQIIRGQYYHEQSVNNRIRVVPIDGPRGRIFDCNGSLLADNRPSYNVAVIPQDMEDQTALFNFLGQVLKKDPTALQHLYQRRRLTPFEPVVVGEDIDHQTLITIEENRFRFPGLVTQQSFERFYPYHEAGGHVLGYVGRISQEEADILQDYGYTPLSTVGKTGVEKFYDAQLEGVSGGRQIEVNSRGQEVRLMGIKDPERGKDIVLTVDERLQKKAAQLLGDRPGSVVVMNLRNGSLLTLVSSPAYDPNVFTDHSRSNEIESYIQNPLSPLLDRAVAGQYAPGSVFKIPVALAAIERRRISTDTTYNCPGYLMLGNRRFGCAHVHGSENIYQALAHSCNVFFYHVGQLVTPPIIGAYAKAFGLGRPTGIDLPFEARGRLVLPGNKPKWYTGDTLNLSIGQGDTMVTPIQLAVLVGAVANDGVILRPRLLKSFDGNSVADPDFSKLPTIRLRKDTWKTIQDGLRQTIEDDEGTAHLLVDLKDMTIWGKTGTAQAGRKGDHAWFAGYVRSPKNNLAFCVFLEHGGASSNAVAITRDLLLTMQQDNII